MQVDPNILHTSPYSLIFLSDLSRFFYLHLVNFANCMCGSLQVNKHAFSGGQDSIEKHRQLGANLEVTEFLSVHKYCSLHVMDPSFI